jgi:hypothetical protein
LTRKLTVSAFFSAPSRYKVVLPFFFCARCLYLRPHIVLIRRTHSYRKKPHLLDSHLKFKLTKLRSGFCIFMKYIFIDRTDLGISIKGQNSDLGNCI